MKLSISLSSSASHLYYETGFWQPHNDVKAGKGILKNKKFSGLENICHSQKTKFPFDIE